MISLPSDPSCVRPVSFIQPMVERSGWNDSLWWLISWLRCGRLIDSRLTGPMLGHSQTSFRCLINTDFGVAEVSHIMKRSSPGVLMIRGIVKTCCRLGDSSPCRLSQRCWRLRCLHSGKRILLLYLNLPLTSVKIASRCLFNHGVLGALGCISHAWLLLL